MKVILGIVCTAAVASAALGQAPPPVPATPAAVDDVVYLRPFTLEQGFKFAWCKEKPTVTSGTLLVLKVNPDLVIPRQVAEPVLYVGDQTAQRINAGNESGHVVVVVPGEVDLARSPIWFGTPELPERVTAEIIRQERAKADAAGIKPFASDKIKAAEAKGGEPANAANMSALLRDVVAPLIVEYSPQEKHLADGFHTPLAKPNPESE
jgi:hypothetical protein